MIRRKLLPQLVLWHSSADPVSNRLDTGWPRRKLLLCQELRLSRSTGVPVSKGSGGSPGYHIGWFSLGPGKGLHGAQS